jgi:flagellar hook-associated protein 2
MGLSTNLVSGLVSGFDWRTMIDQLIEIEHRRVDLVEDRKTEYEAKLSEWQSVNTMLLSLKTAAYALSTETAFNVYTASTTSSSTTPASNLLTVSTSSSASPGMYNIKVNNLAQSEKISSKSYTATDTALGWEGDILVSGRVVNIVDTDTLADIKDKINGVNTGSNPSNVTASIVARSSTDYHLVLTSDETGEDGLSVLQATYDGGDDILEQMGFISDTTTTIKNTTSDGAKSDLFASSDGAIKDLLNLSNVLDQDITVQIAGTGVDINLYQDSLTDIAQAIDAVSDVSASVVTETVDGETQYRIDISGTTTFSDTGNVLQTLGILKGTYETKTEVHTGSVANTTDGSNPITENTEWKDIYGADVQNGTSFTITGKDHDGNDVSGSFTISDNKDEVSELFDYIETTVFGGTVDAAIDGDGKIQITDTAPGDSQLEITLVTNNPAGGTLDFGEISVSTEGRSMQVAAGEDAEIVVDNVTITDSSNTITDVIAGATLNLVGEDSSTTVTLKVERDLATIKSKIQDLVDAYNDIMDYINTQFSYDEETETTGGILFGDGTLSSVKTELINTVTQTITGLSSDYNSLALIGITLDLTNTEEGKYEDLTLIIDDDDLTDALESNFNDVRNLFIAYGSSTNPNIEYIGHIDDTVGGTYDVEITQPATRTTFTGLNSLTPPATLGEPVTVTVEDYATGREATVNLTSGMDIDDVVNAINSELALEYTEKLVGDGENAGVTSSTLFNAAAVGGSDNDVITFSGTRRNGLHVSGSYTIGDATTETVGDLLESIEDMFEDEVTAALDANGKLIITDKQAGDSQLAFTIDTSALSSLDLGTVDVDPTGADGSQEGRYAIPITASKTGSDELLLTHNTYGTGHGIVVSQTSATDPLGLTGVSQVWGKDVEGSINSVTATGSGQRLTLDSDGNNADGLSISYSGTGTTTTIFTLTLGIAELLDRQLGFITDASDGYVTYKQTSLKNSVDSHETQIEQMEAQLNLKMERMINQFVAMEVALSRIQNQSDWLTGQINASFSGWWAW